MRKFQLLAAAALALGVGSAAQAQTAAEYFHAPAAGVQELTVRGSYALGTIQGSGAGAAEVDLNGIRNLGVGWAYGINEMFSVGADIGYTSIDNSDGIEPVKLFANGKTALGMGTLLYGVRAQFALVEADIDSNGDTNRTIGDPLSGLGEGGIEIAPYVAWSTAVGPGLLGASISYEIVNTDTDLKGGGSLEGGAEGNAAVFYEYMLADMPLGAALKYRWFTANDGLDNARSLIGVDLYTRLTTGSVDILPSLLWMEKASSDAYDKLSDVRISLAARFAF